MDTNQAQDAATQPEQTPASLTRFVTARIAEDESRAGISDPGRSAARLQAEARAKRAIAALHYDAGPSQGQVEDDYVYLEHACGTCGKHGEFGEAFPCDTIRAMASVYSEHPQYRTEWRI